ncbi:hypothetical protein GOODEAATRI_010246 [Goodea atripinnis]|uniref:Ribosomal protein S10 n=1 Tax=Goodea atripinnis TaxID=208336 RepID=A0ABV0MS92_9TELE
MLPGSRSLETLQSSAYRRFKTALKKAQCALIPHRQKILQPEYFISVSRALDVVKKNNYRHHFKQMLHIWWLEGKSKHQYYVLLLIWLRSLEKITFLQPIIGKKIIQEECFKSRY